MCVGGNVARAYVGCSVASGIRLDCRHADQGQGRVETWCTRWEGVDVAVHSGGRVWRDLQSASGMSVSGSTDGSEPSGVGCEGASSEPGTEPTSGAAIGGGGCGAVWPEQPAGVEEACRAGGCNVAALVLAVGGLGGVVVAAQVSVCMAWGSCAGGA